MSFNPNIFNNNNSNFNGTFSGGVNFSNIADTIANLGGVAADIINAVNNGKNDYNNSNTGSIPDKPINTPDINFQKNNQNPLDKSFFNAGLFIVVAVFLLTKK